MVRGSRVLFLNRVSDARAVAFHARRTLPALWHVSPVSLFPIEEKGVGVRLFKRNYGSLILIYTYRSYTILQHSCAHKLWRENLNSFYVWIYRLKGTFQVHAHAPLISKTWAQCIQRLRSAWKKSHDRTKYVHSLYISSWSRAMQNMAEYSIINYWNANPQYKALEFVVPSILRERGN